MTLVLIQQRALRQLAQAHSVHESSVKSFGKKIRARVGGEQELERMHADGAGDKSLFQFLSHFA